MSMMMNEAENHEYSMESMHTVINGSAPVSKELFDDFRETFPLVENIISSKLFPYGCNMGCAVIFLFSVWNDWDRLDNEDRAK